MLTGSSPVNNTATSEIGFSNLKNFYQRYPLLLVMASIITLNLFLGPQICFCALLLAGTAAYLHSPKKIEEWFYKNQGMLIGSILGGLYLSSTLPIIGLPLGLTLGGWLGNLMQIVGEKVMTAINIGQKVAQPLLHPVNVGQNISRGLWNKVKEAATFIFMEEIPAPVAPAPTTPLALTTQGATGFVLTEPTNFTDKIANFFVQLATASNNETETLPERQFRFRTHIPLPFGLFIPLRFTKKEEPVSAPAATPLLLEGNSAPLALPPADLGATSAASSEIKEIESEVINTASRALTPSFQQQQNHLNATRPSAWQTTLQRMNENPLTLLKLLSPFQFRKKPY